MRTKILRYIFAAGMLALPAMMPITAHACTNPVGVAGDAMYNDFHDTFQYCDGTNWIGVGTENYTGHLPNGVDFGTVGSTASEWDNTSLTGAADSKMITISTWFKDDDGGAEAWLVSCDTTHGEMFKFFSNGGGNRVPRIIAENAAGEAILEISDSAGHDALSDGQWHHLLISIDLNNPANTHFYIDDVDRTNIVTYDSGNADFTFDFTPDERWHAGSTCGGNQDTASSFADFWVDLGTYIDISVEANRRLFIDANGYPVNLGANGETPTGTAPEMFFTGDTSTWMNNAGTGGAFTLVTGSALTTDPFSTTNYADGPMSGLIGWWKFDETTGTTAYDSSGNSLHGTLTNGMDAANDGAPGIIGTALGPFLQGTTNRRVDFGAAPELNLADDPGFTISAWVKTDSYSAHKKIIQRGSGTGNNGSYDLGQYVSNNRYIFRIMMDTNANGDADTAANLYSPNNAVVLNRWQHLVARYDGTDMTLFIDNNLVGTTTPSDPFADAALAVYQETAIGGEGRNDTSSYPGIIDDVRVYNRALSDPEIAALYDTGRPCDNPSASAGSITFNAAEGVHQYCSRDGWKAMYGNTANVYAANPVTFDGTNDTLSGTLSGLSDSKLWTGSLWFRMNTLPGTNGIYSVFDSDGNADVSIGLNDGPNPYVVIFAKTTADANGLNIRSTRITDTDWHHVMWSVDMADPSRRHVYLDGVEALNGAPTYNDVALGFGSPTTYYVGEEQDGTLIFDGDLADMWMAPGVYIDLSIEANRRKFITPDGAPVNLGSDGSNPTGSAPAIFLSGTTDSWHTNKGTAGGFTENGALTDAATALPTGSNLKLLDGLVGWWKFDENTGVATAIDSSTTANDGAFTNTTETQYKISGAQGTAIQVPSSGGTVQVPFNSAYQSTQTSFSMWVKHPGGGADHFIQFGSPAVTIYWVGASETIRFVDNRWDTQQGSWRMDGVQVPADNNWHHVVITYDASSTANQPQMYIDTVLNTSFTGVTTPIGTHVPAVTGDLYIGTDDALNNSFDAPIDDVRIYNRILSASEVAEIYSASNVCANPSGKTGDIVYNTTEDVLQGCNGSEWRAIGKYQ